MKRDRFEASIPLRTTKRQQLAIKKAAKKNKCNQQEYIRAAISEQLKKDGYE